MKKLIENLLNILDKYPKPGEQFLDGMELLVYILGIAYIAMNYKTIGRRSIEGIKYMGRLAKRLKEL